MRWSSSLESAAGLPIGASNWLSDRGNICIRACQICHSTRNVSKNTRAMWRLRAHYQVIVEAGDGVDGGRQRAAKAGLAIGSARGAEEGYDSGRPQLEENEANDAAAKGHLAALAHRAEAPLFGHGMEGGELVDAVDGRVERAFLLGRGLQRIEVPLHGARRCIFRALDSFYDG